MDPANYKIHFTYQDMQAMAVPQEIPFTLSQGSTQGLV